MLSDNQIKKLKASLIKTKKSLEKQLFKFAKKDEKIKDNYKTEFPDIGTQADENAQEVTEYEQNISLEHSLEDELLLIKKALQKIKNGNYGSCEVCGKEIPFERLKIRPQATMCTTCKSKKEAQ